MPVSDWAGLFQSAGQQYGIDPALLQAMATQESGGNAQAVSPQGAVGPMQLMPATAKTLGVTDPTDPAQAIPAAARLLTQNSKQFGSPEQAVLAYHGGTDKKNWGPKTQAYLAKVTQNYQQLKSGNQVASPQSANDPFSIAFGSDAVPASKTSAPPAAQAPYFPAGDSRNGPAAVTVGNGDPFSVAFGGSDKVSAPAAASKPLVRPTVPKQPWGFTQQIGASLPFAKDILAGGGAALDTVFGRAPTISDLVSGNSAPTFGDIYHANLNQLNEQQADYAKANPGLSLTAAGTGLLMTGKPSGQAANALATLPNRVWSGIKTGAKIGGLYGLGEAAPLDQRLQNTAVGAATGAGTGGILPVAGAVVRPVAHAIGATASAVGEKLGAFVPDYAARADNMLLRALGRDSTTPTEVVNALSAAPAGKPLTVMDVAGSNVQRQARNLVTVPGQAGDKIVTFLGDRTENQSGRVLGDIGQHLSSNTDVYGVGDNLIKARTAAAAPLYQEAFAGGSTAPLEDQFRDELQATTGAKGTIAKQIKAIEENSPGALAARGAAGADTRAKYLDLHEQLKQAETARQEAAAVFERAKTDGSANAPGAVWNPRIQQFINDPIVKQGINKGLEVQRLEALAEGKTFNPTEYAITGTAPDGSPQVGSVPNMRLLDAAKRGLDDILEGYRDPVTGRMNLDQRGRAIDQVRRALLTELDTLNPKYKAARAAWAGPSQSNSAMNMGESFLNADPEQIEQSFSKLSAGDKDFYRVGAARAIQDRANSASDSTDLSKRLFGNARVRAQIESVFGTGAADKFGAAMGAEGKMASTNRTVLGGPNTANKIADLADSHHELAQDILHGGLHGGPAGAVVMPTLKAVGRGINNLFTGMHPQVANHLADALTASGQSAAHIYSRLAAEQAARHAAALRFQALGAGGNRLFSGFAGHAAATANPQ